MRRFGTTPASSRQTSSKSSVTRRGPAGAGARLELSPESKIDFVGSKVTGSHEGGFKGFKGEINLVDGDPTKSSIKVAIDTNSLWSDSERLTGHLKSADFFDVEKFPTMTFTSKRVEGAGEGSLRLVGDLTIKGVTKEVVLDVEGPTAPVKNPWGMTVAGATASTTIKRSDFGITWNKVIETGGVVVGDDVKITIDVELIKVEPAPAK